MVEQVQGSPPGCSCPTNQARVIVALVTLSFLLFFKAKVILLAPRSIGLAQCRDQILTVSVQLLWVFIPAVLQLLFRYFWSPLWVLEFPRLLGFRQQIRIRRRPLIRSWGSRVEQHEWTVRSVVQAVDAQTLECQC